MNPAARERASRLVDALLPDADRERLRSIRIADRGFGYDLFGCERQSLELAYLALHLLYERYFRVESRGHAHIPADGPLIVAANHSGVLPIDATMIAVDLVKRMDPPRFYRAVVDNYAAAVPYVGVFMQRVGQVIGTRRNFKELLEAGEMVGVFPEGAKGTGKPFAQRYRLLRFNVGFVELSLQHRVPIVPVAVVGAEEQAPMLLDLKPIARLIGAPYFPLTPTFPLLGPLGAIPYPSRYRLRYGEPIRLYETVDPDATLEDPRLLRELAQDVRERIQAMIDTTLAERRSVFFLIRHAAEDSSMPRNGKHSVLITGATGVIGRQLAERLYYDDPRIRHIMAVALEPRRPYYFDEYDSKRFSYHSLNILRSRDLNNLFLSPRFRDAEIDTVVHLAYMDRLSHPPRERHVLNVDGTRALLKRCSESHGIKKFIFLSSWSVYKLKPHNSVLLDPDSELNFDAGANSWIKDRIDTDMLCRTEMERNGTQILVLRPSGIIGRNVRSQINEYLSGAVCPMVAGFNPMVNLVHMVDVIRALRCGIHRNAAGVYNIVGQDTAPLADFVRLAGRPKVTLPEAGVRLFNELQRRARLTRYDFSVQPELIKYPCVPDGNGAFESLGYHPTHHVRF